MTDVSENFSNVDQMKNPEKRNISPARLIRRPVELKNREDDDSPSYIINGEKVDLSTLKLIPVPSRSTSPEHNPNKDVESDLSAGNSPKNILSDEGSPEKRKPSKTPTPASSKRTSSRKSSKTATPIDDQKSSSKRTSSRTSSKTATPIEEEKPSSRKSSKTATPIKEEKVPSKTATPIVSSPKREEKPPSKTSTPIVSSPERLPSRKSSKATTPVISSPKVRSVTPERDDNYILIQTQNRSGTPINVESPPRDIKSKAYSKPGTPIQIDPGGFRRSTRRDETPKPILKKNISEEHQSSSKRVSMRDSRDVTPLPSPIPNWENIRRKKIATPINEDDEEADEIISKPILIDRFKVMSPSDQRLKLATPKYGSKSPIQVFVENQPETDEIEPIEPANVPKPVKQVKWNNTPYTPSIPLFTTTEVNEPEEIQEEISKDKIKSEFDELIADNPNKKIDPFNPSKKIEVEKARLMNEIRKVKITDTIRFYQFWILLISMMVELLSAKIELDVSGFAEQQKMLMNKYEKILKKIADKSYGDFLEGLPPEVQLFGTMLFYFLATVIIRYVVSFFKDKPQYVELCEKGFFYLLRGNDITDTKTGPNGETNEIAALLIKAVPFLKVFLGGGNKEEPTVQEVPVESVHGD